VLCSCARSGTLPGVRSSALVGRTPVLGRCSFGTARSTTTKQGRKYCPSWYHCLRVTFVEGVRESVKLNYERLQDISRGSFERRIEKKHPRDMDSSLRSSQLKFWSAGQLVNTPPIEERWGTARLMACSPRSRPGELR